MDSFIEKTSRRRLHNSCGVLYFLNAAVTRLVLELGDTWQPAIFREYGFENTL